MLTGTCQPALEPRVISHENTLVSLIDRHLWNDVAVSWWVAIGVGAAGVYDFHQGKPPQGVIDLDAGIALTVFIAACAATAVLTTLPNVLRSGKRAIFRCALLMVSIVPSLLADPTYSCLLIATSLMDVRRRDNPRVRTTLTAGLLTLVAVLLLTENTARITAEIEAMISIGIAFMIIALLGDTLRKVDEGLVIRTELALLNERVRMAEDLHDSVGHHLLAASVQLQKAMVLRKGNSSVSYQSVSMAQQAISEAINDTRVIVGATRDYRLLFSFEAEIRSLVQRMTADSPDIAISITGDHSSLDHFTQLALYRVVQEALSNLIRHSAATRAEIRSAVTGDTATLSITDNGCGFASAAMQESGGLRNITRRVEDLGGKITIDSEPGCTSITVMVPT